MKPLMVSTEMIAPLWGVVRELLEPAIELFNGYTIGDILAELQMGRAILWIAADDDHQINAAVVVQIVEYPRTRSCLIRCAGGKEVQQWVGLVKDLEEWAAALGCKNIRFVGRDGWSKLLPDYNTPARLYVKQLGDE